MFSMIPWKKRQNDGAISVHHAGPSPHNAEQPLARFRNGIDSLLNGFLDNPWFDNRFSRCSSLRNAPQMSWNWDLGWEEGEQEFVVYAEAPGFEPEDFEVKVSGNLLTVCAEHNDEKRDRNRRSYRYGSFSRTVTLPRGIKEAEIDAHYRSGVLELHLPKCEQARGKRIEVTSA